MTKSFGPKTAEMPFLDHLEELRWRIIRCLIAVVIGAVVGFVLVDHYNVLGLLIAPIEPFLYGSKLKYLSPTDPFFITIQLAILVGLVLASPIIIYQIWAFFAPALLPSEKRAIVPALYLGVVLFGAGVAMAYFAALPVTLKFTMGFQTAALEQNIVISEYLSFVTRLLLAFGVVFELPVVILVLSVIGVVTPEFLASKRRHAIAAITVLASVITPGDVITLTVMMMVPLIALYELSIWLSRLVTRRRELSPAAAGAEA
jgi:sec-independent protein translocase protein TatC